MKNFILVILFSILYMLTSLSAHSQNTNAYSLKDSTKSGYDKYKLPSIIFGVGIASYRGELHPYRENILSIGNHNFGINIGVEKRFGNFLGLSINGLYGQLCEKDFIKNFQHYNFLTNIYQGEFNVIYHFDNDLLLRKKSRFAPYVFTGIGFMGFNSKGDLKDSKNRKYFYWNDGSIKDRSEDYDNPNLGNTLKRDYNYETKLDSTNAYKHNTFTFPLGIGIKFKLSDKFESNIYSIYYFTSTDNLDGYKEKGVDKYIYSAVSLKYNLSGKTKERPKLKDFILNDTTVVLDTIGPKDTIKTTFTYTFNDSLNTAGLTLKDLVKKQKEEIEGQQLTPEEKKLIAEGKKISPEGKKAKRKKNIIDYTFQYKVQIGAVKNGNSKKYYAQKFNLNEDDIIVDTYENGYKYSVGFKTLDEAKEFNKKIRNEKNVKSFIVTYKEDKRIILPSGFNEEKPTEVGGNIVYRVQLASLNNKESKKYFLDKYGIEDNIYIERYQGTYKYYVGSFSTYKGARQYCDNLRKRNIDSFVICYKDGKRISVKTALKLTSE
ncbi:MAG: SPOR domain-containing protein [Bacteroidota bacterium]|nr:SPOR domain-containing protein [Bacteroidota bacterium]